jgi:hypothetical protein
MSYDVPPMVPVHLRNSQDEDGLWIDGARLSVLRRQGKEPTFGVKDLATIFFAKSGSWLRMRSQPPGNPEPGTQAARHPMGWFTVWGDIRTPLIINRVKGRDETYEFRRFTLLDAELMLWSFYEHQVLDAVNYFTSIVQTGKRAEHRMNRYQDMVADAERQLHTGLEIVKWIGRLWDVTPMPPPTIILRIPSEEELESSEFALLGAAELKAEIEERDEYPDEVDDGGADGGTQEPAGN